MAGLGAQPSQGDHDQSVDGRLGREGAGCCQGVEAVARQLFWCDVVPDGPSLCGRGQQVSDEVTELALRSTDVLILMHERGHVAALAPVGYLVGDHCVGLEHCFKCLARVVGPVTQLDEPGQVVAHVAFVPGHQDRFHVWEVLVQGGPSDPGVLRDLRHRHSPQTVLGHERPGGVDDGVMHLAVVGLQCLAPQPWHTPSIRLGW